jgi:hypothetical protein
MWYIDPSVSSFSFFQSSNVPRTKKCVVSNSALAERERLFLDSKTEEAEDEDSVIQISSFARLVASNS